MIDRAAVTNWGAAHPWVRKSFVEQDLKEKLAVPDYAADVPLLLSPGTPFDLHEAFALVRDTFIRPLDDTP